MIAIRDSYVQNALESNQYQALTRSYAQKSFTIFNLLLSACLVDGCKLPIIIQPIRDTVHEMLETKLNIMLLIWRKKACIPVKCLDASIYETEFVDYLESIGKLESIDELLPSIENLQQISKHNSHLFSMIKAYEILSIVLQQSVVNGCLISIECLTITQLIELMDSTIDDNVIDDISNPIWKYINAQLLRDRINGGGIDEKNVCSIVKNVRIMCSAQKSSNLRRTATETISMLIPYYANEHKRSANLELLIDICDLLLGLLHDDDVHVRNRSSEIIMTLIRKPGSIESHEGA